MLKRCEERHAGWAKEITRPHSNGLTLQRAGQMAEAFRASHIERRSFAPGRRCVPLKGITLPAEPRLALTQNSAAHCGKMIEYGP